MKTTPSGKGPRAKRPANNTAHSSSAWQTKRSGPDPFPIVGIGASAGGLEAMTQLLKTLPGETGMAFVLVQHVDPTHESALTSLLSRLTPMGSAYPARTFAPPRAAFGSRWWI